MAEATGLVLGGVGLVGLMSTCVEILEYLENRTFHPRQGVVGICGSLKQYELPKRLKMGNLAQVWINHLRRQARNDQLRHLDGDIELPSPRIFPQPALSDDPGPEDFTPARKRLKSPTTSVNADRTRSPSPARRSKGRHNTLADKSITNFPARPTARKRGHLWNEVGPTPTRNLPVQSAPQQHPRQSPARDNRQATYQARERRFLPLEINGTPAYALPDTGVTGNAICEDYAREIGAPIESLSSRHHFVNAMNQTFESVGTTKLTISIPAALSKTPPRSEWTCSFAVVKHLAAPLVLGNQFLRKTGALVSLAHLMVRKTLSVVSDKVDQLRKVWMFMHMNLPTQKLGCSLDAEPAFADLDSGSDIDVVSLSYAKFRDWQIAPLPEDEGYVLLANNELVKLAGYVDTTLGIRGGCVPRRLYVLDGLVCDVVLGDPTIEALDIFNEFQSSLVDTTAAEGMDLFCNIQCVDKIKQIEHEVDQLLAERPGAAFIKMGRNWWTSSLPKGGASRKEKSTDDEGIVEELYKRLEIVNVCSANCRRDYEAQLMILSGDDHTRKKEEFDKSKKQNDELRDKIRQHIKERSRMP